MSAVIPKHQRFRSDRLRQAPKGEVCVICEQHGEYRSAVGVCHLPHGKIGFPAGMGQKTHDWLGAHLCQRCHDYIDGPRGRNDHAFRMMALALTLDRLFRRGILIVLGEQHAEAEDDEALF